MSAPSRCVDAPGLNDEQPAPGGESSDPTEQPTSQTNEQISARQSPPETGGPGTDVTAAAPQRRSPMFTRTRAAIGFHRDGEGHGLFGGVPGGPMPGQPPAGRPPGTPIPDDQESPDGTSGTDSSNS